MPKPKKATKPSAHDTLNGAELHIDHSVTEICEMYNKTSGATRAVIYILVLVSIIACTAVVNTTRINWTRSRLRNINYTLRTDEINKGNAAFHYRHIQDSLNRRYHELKGLPKIDTDKLAKIYRSELTRTKLSYRLLRARDSIKIDVDREIFVELLKTKINDNGRVTIPLIGNSFDVDNLGHIAGITFIVLLVMLRFALAREKDNLKIAFDTISKRYIKDEEETEYHESEKAGWLAKKQDETEEQYGKRMLQELVKSNREEMGIPLNFRRRRYHYNALSMNELFNLPPLDVSRNITQETKLGYVVANHLFFFPYVIYILIYANDTSTFFNGWRLSTTLTIFSYICGFFYLGAIAFLCESCNKQKRIINMSFADFRKEHYYFESDHFRKKHQPPFSIRTAIFYIPGILLYYFNEPRERREELREEFKVRRRWRKIRRNS